jgi:hypothetical protein
MDRFEHLEIHPSEILHDADKSNCMLQHAFRNLARMFFENWEFVLKVMYQIAIPEQANK